MPLHPWRRESFKSLFLWSEGVERRDKREKRCRNEPKAEKDPRHSHFPMLVAGPLRASHPTPQWAWRGVGRSQAAELRDSLPLRTWQPRRYCSLVLIWGLLTLVGALPSQGQAGQKYQDGSGVRSSLKNICTLGPGPCQLLRLSC